MAVVWAGANTSTGGTLQYQWDETWRSWVTAGSTTTSVTMGATANTVWTHWVATEVTNEQHRADAEQARREFESRMQLRGERERVAEAQRLAAEERAAELLPDVLTPDQLAQYHADLEVTVQGQSGRLYVVEMVDSVHGNLLEVDEHGCRLARMCVAPQMRDHEGGVMPRVDGWVGQILALRFNEEELLAHANRSGVRGCTVVAEEHREALYRAALAA